MTSIICRRNFLNIKLRNSGWVGLQLHGLPPAKNEYLDEPQYPSIPPLKTKDEREAENLVETVSKFRTVEEKLFYLNKPKYFGWFSCILNIGKTKYGIRDFLQSATYTHVVDGLPDVYDELEEKAQHLADKLLPSLEKMYLNDQGLIEHAMEVSNDKIPYRQPRAVPMPSQKPVIVEEKSKKLMEDLDRLIQMHLAPDVPHLFESQVDFKTRSEAFWFRGGFHPDERMLKKRLGVQKSQKRRQHVRDIKMTDEKVHEKYDRALQIEGYSVVQRRHALALKPIVQLDDDLCRQGDKIPEYAYIPENESYKSKCQPGTNVPGYWTYSGKRFTSLQYISNRNVAGSWMDEQQAGQLLEFTEREDMLLNKALKASFAVCLPEACYLGFSPLNDPDHPLITQTIVSDGLRFKLAVYQLNKTALFDQDKVKEGKNNLIWHDKEFSLMEIDSESQKKSINMEGLKKILKFYLMQPDQVVEPRAKFMADIKDDYSRQYFTNTFLYMYSKRERHLLKPEIQAYQKLYMIDHNMLHHFGFRERPWFIMAKYHYLGREHWHPEFKHYDHYEPQYVPKKFRKDKPWEKRLKKVVPPIEEGDEE